MAADAPPPHMGSLAIANPTGDCTAEAGVRPGYSVPAQGTVWLPDCKNPLKREYWRVYAVASHSAYVLPRPDGAYQLDIVCNDDTHPLRPLIDRYRLCHVATAASVDGGGSPGDVDVVNDMEPADALEITHFLHTQLLFEATEGMPGINLRPFAIPGDVLDACALHPGMNSSELTSDCHLEQQYVDTGVEPLPDFFRTATEMVRLLNELYGIGNCAAGETPTRACADCGPVDQCRNVGIFCAAPCSSDNECSGRQCAQGRCQVGSLCG
jgi:hypothetical protein